MKLILLKTPTCPYCPIASQILKELQKELNFEYEELDATKPKGMALAIKHKVSAVPAIISVSKKEEKLAFVGVPKKEDILKILEEEHGKV